MMIPPIGENDCHNFIVTLTISPYLVGLLLNWKCFYVFFGHPVDAFINICLSFIFGPSLLLNHKSDSGSLKPRDAVALWGNHHGAICNCTKERHMAIGAFPGEGYLFRLYCLGRHCRWDLRYSMKFVVSPIEASNSHCSTTVASYIWAQNNIP